MRKAVILIGMLMGYQAHGLRGQTANPNTAGVTEVLVLGVYHLSNPGHDLHNAQAGDVLSAKGQAEVTAVIQGLARFHPNKIAVEWSAGDVVDRFPKFVAGTLPASKNEVVQLGFRLAKASGTNQVYGIDADGDFPWERVSNFAKAYGYKDLLAKLNSPADALQLQSVITNSGMIPALRLLNTPDRIAQSNWFYRDLLRIGEGTDQPGADLVSAWYHRNLLICSNLLQLSKPGDRVVLIFGAGHTFLLRQCVLETPGLRLIEPLSFLPDREP